MFDRLKRENRKALIAYLTAGDPLAPPLTSPAARRSGSSEGGADLIETRRPPSAIPSPMGPVIQRGRGAGPSRAGTTLRSVLENRARKSAKTSQVPLLLFTYLNPVIRYGDR